MSPTQPGPLPSGCLCHPGLRGGEHRRRSTWRSNPVGREPALGWLTIIRRIGATGRNGSAAWSPGRFHRRMDVPMRPGGAGMRWQSGAAPILFRLRIRGHILRPFAKGTEEWNQVLAEYAAQPQPVLFEAFPVRRHGLLLSFYPPRSIANRGLGAHRRENPTRWVNAPVPLIVPARARHRYGPPQCAEAGRYPAFPKNRDAAPFRYLPGAYPGLRSGCCSKN